MVVRFQSGDEQAFDELMARYKLPVVNFVYRILNDVGEADDVAQEVFVRVYRHGRRFKADGKSRFSTWLFQIARNQSLDVLRRRKRRPVETRDMCDGGDHSPMYAGPSADGELSNKEIGEAVARAVADLPEKQRTVVICAEYHGMSHAEIAGVMDCTVKSVESRLARARQVLRQTLSFLNG